MPDKVLAGKASPSSLAAAALTCVSAAQAQQHTVRVAVVRALTSTPLMIADQKGYFKEHGIKVEVSDIDTTALVPLAQNQIQVMEAGMTAGYFNALEKDFPITIASDRAATPILHKLLIRPDLKDQIKKIADLKGRTIAVNGTASVVNYELGKLLETVGLTIKDVELKVLPFPQMGVGLANKAVDAAVVIPPWAFQLVDQNIGAVLVDVDDHVKPTPLSIAVAFINTDWARQNARSRATSSSPISAAFGNTAKPTTTGRTGRK